MLVSVVETDNNQLLWQCCEL